MAYDEKTADRIRGVRARQGVADGRRAGPVALTGRSVAPYTSFPDGHVVSTNSVTLLEVRAHDTTGSDTTAASCLDHLDEGP
ncbi:MAG: hypothetical protein U0169_04460 [Polyangiaceae bacterium]